MVTPGAVTGPATSMLVSPRQRTFNSILRQPSPSSSHDDNKNRPHPPFIVRATHPRRRMVVGSLVVLALIGILLFSMTTVYIVLSQPEEPMITPAISTLKSVATATGMKDGNDTSRHSPSFLSTSATTTSSLQSSSSSSFSLQVLPKAKPFICSLGGTMTTMNGNSTTTASSSTAINPTEGTTTTVRLPLKCPHFLIVGAQKCGTTALFETLAQHPLLHPTVTAETHFFDWHYPVTSKGRAAFMARYNLSLSSSSSPSSSAAAGQSTLTEADQCSIRTAYIRSNFDFSNGTRFLFFEKTPSYLFLSHIPKLIYDLCDGDDHDENDGQSDHHIHGDERLDHGRRLLPPPSASASASTTTTARRRDNRTKIIVLLRNPIDRAYSHFDMKIRTHGRSFEQVVEEEVDSLRKLGLSDAPSLTEYRSIRLLDKTIHNNSSNGNNVSMFDIPSRVLHQWSRTERQARHWKHYRKVFANNYLQRGLYWEQLEPWLRYFRLNDTMLVLQYETFQRYPKRTYRQVLEFVGVPRSYLAFLPPDGFSTRYNPRSAGQPPLDGITREYLANFFRPHNERLAELLGIRWGKDYRGGDWQWER